MWYWKFLWLWFGLGVDELGALLGFYSLDGLVWEWFRLCGSGWFDSVVVLCWLLGFYSFAWVWSSCSLIRWWWFGVFYFPVGFFCVCLPIKFMGLKAKSITSSVGISKFWPNKPLFTPKSPSKRLGNSIFFFRFAIVALQVWRVL